MRDGVPADAFGVGSQLRGGEPLSAVYKLVEQPGEQDPAVRYTMKLSPGKINDPGAHQVWRDADGRTVLALADEPADGEPLLREVMRDGARTDAAPRLHDDRRHAAAERARTAGQPPPTLMRSPRLLALRARLGAAGVQFPLSETALIAVDVQHDFLPGGALGVAGGDAVIAPLVAAAQRGRARRQDARRASRRALLVRRAGRHLAGALRGGHARGASCTPTSPRSRAH